MSIRQMSGITERTLREALRLHPDLFRNPQITLIEDLIQAGKAGEGKLFRQDGAGFRLRTVGFEGRSAAGFMADNHHVHILLKGVNDLKQSRGRGDISTLVVGPDVSLLGSYEKHNS